MTLIVTSFTENVNKRVNEALFDTLIYGFSVLHRFECRTRTRVP